jgi:hypothetical protein
MHVCLSNSFTFSASRIFHLMSCRPTWIHTSPTSTNRSTRSLSIETPVSRHMTMCQYQYHYYAYCQHQEFILVSFCGRAAPLSQRAGKQQEVDTNNSAEGATQTPKESSTSSSLTVSSPNFFSVKTPSSASTGKVHHPTHHGSSFRQHRSHPLSRIIHIILVSVPTSNVYHQRRH